jgi:hypothetical protein
LCPDRSTKHDRERPLQKEEEAIPEVLAGSVDNGVRIISVWQSKAQHDRFVTERLHPIFERLGTPGHMTCSDFTAEDVVLGPVAATRIQQCAVRTRCRRRTSRSPGQADQVPADPHFTLAGLADRRILIRTKYADPGRPLSPQWWAR